MKNFSRRNGRSHQTEQCSEDEQDGNTSQLEARGQSLRALFIESSLSQNAPHGTMIRDKSASVALRKGPVAMTACESLARMVMSRPSPMSPTLTVPPGRLLRPMLAQVQSSGENTSVVGEPVYFCLNNNRSAKLGAAVTPNKAIKNSTRVPSAVSVSAISNPDFMISETAPATPLSSSSSLSEETTSELTSFFDSPQKDTPTDPEDSVGQVEQQEQELLERDRCVFTPTCCSGSNPAEKEASVAHQNHQDSDTSTRAKIAAQNVVVNNDYKGDRSHSRSCSISACSTSTHGHGSGCRFGSCDAGTLHADVHGKGCRSSHVSVTTPCTLSRSRSANNMSASSSNSCMWSGCDTPTRLQSDALAAYDNERRVLASRFIHNAPNINHFHNPYHCQCGLYGAALPLRFHSNNTPPRRTLNPLINPNSPLNPPLDLDEISTEANSSGEVVREGCGDQTPASLRNTTIATPVTDEEKTPTIASTRRQRQIPALRFPTSRDHEHHQPPANATDLSLVSMYSPHMSVSRYRSQGRQPVDLHGSDERDARHLCGTRDDHDRNGPCDQENVVQVRIMSNDKEKKQLACPIPMKSHDNESLGHLVAAAAHVDGAMQLGCRPTSLIPQQLQQKRTQPEHGHHHRPGFRCHQNASPPPFLAALSPTGWARKWHRQSAAAMPGHSGHDYCVFHMYDNAADQLFFRGPLAVSVNPGEPSAAAVINGMRNAARETNTIPKTVNAVAPPLDDPAPLQAPRGVAVHDRHNAVCSPDGMMPSNDTKHILIEEYLQTCCGAPLPSEERLPSGREQQQCGLDEECRSNNTSHIHSATLQLTDTGQDLQGRFSTEAVHPKQNDSIVFSYSGSIDRSCRPSLEPGIIIAHNSNSLDRYNSFDGWDGESPDGAGSFIGEEPATPHQFDLASRRYFHHSQEQQQQYPSLQQGSSPHPSAVTMTASSSGMACVSDSAPRLFTDTGYEVLAGGGECTPVVSVGSGLPAVWGEGAGGLSLRGLGLTSTPPLAPYVDEEEEDTFC